MKIKNHNSNYNIINVFKYLTYKCDNLEKSRKKIIVKNNQSFDFKINELNNQPNIQPNIISLEENAPNMSYNDFFYNQNNHINEQKAIKEAQKFNENNINSPNYDITNSVNKLLINYLFSNNSLNSSNLLKENFLFLLTLQNNILSNINNINNINFIHNIYNNINLNGIKYKNNINDINNYNIINNLNNENENIINKIKNDLLINIDKKIIFIQKMITMIIKIIILV